MSSIKSQRKSVLFIKLNEIWALFNFIKNQTHETNLILTFAFVYFLRLTFLFLIKIFFVFSKRMPGSEFLKHLGILHCIHMDVYKSIFYVRVFFLFSKLALQRRGAMRCPEWASEKGTKLL